MTISILKKIKKVDSFKCSDGMCFDIEQKAFHHERSMKIKKEVAKEIDRSLSSMAVKISNIYKKNGTFNRGANQGFGETFHWTAMDLFYAEKSPSIDAFKRHSVFDFLMVLSSTLKDDRFGDFFVRKEKK